MKVLITGAAGQVGRALQSNPPPQWQLRALSKSSLDIADPRAVDAAIMEWRPDLIINAAAYTAVDKAETESELAFAINADGPKNLARAVLAWPACRLIHISTDYVFDGTSATPYKPGDQTRPVSVYGRSKLHGEQAVHDILGARAVILRTAWVYAADGKNFLLTMLRVMNERKSVRVVADQHGSPTSADSIATAIWAIAQRQELHGILHWTDSGSTTWYDFAVAIAEDGHAAGLLSGEIQVTPITTADYPTAAQRPARSVLDTAATVAQLGFTPLPWRTRLRAILADLKPN